MLAADLKWMLGSCPSAILRPLCVPARHEEDAVKRALLLWNRWREYTLKPKSSTADGKSPPDWQYTSQGNMHKTHVPSSRVSQY